jgi:hypothetical protein
MADNMSYVRPLATFSSLNKPHACRHECGRRGDRLNDADDFARARKPVGSPEESHAGHPSR